MNKPIKSVLFLPFLQIPSGHHQVANALINDIKENIPGVNCEKIDILAYSYGIFEKMISSIYLKWIRSFPSIYNSIYQNAVYRNDGKEKRYRLYELLFLYFIKKLVLEKKPNLIVCTHSLPAYMLNYLKNKGKIHVPVINVYTDYFVHQFWGIKNIDYHFVPSVQVEKFLMERGVEKEKIFITGIPIHSNIMKKSRLELPSHTTYSVLICGGNLGVGAMDELIEEIKQSQSIEFKVLCGKNEKLYNKLRSLSIDHIIPYPYIECMSKMNQIYDNVDAIITKPGGVTVSECLFKRKPIFIYHTLPGQEKINFEELKEFGLVFSLTKNKVCEEVHSVLGREKELIEYQNRVDRFHADIHSDKPVEIIAKLLAR